ncbi:putative pyridoxal-phosphate dependent enzyme [Diaporthe ampelina]|uniref:Putative pyridoxal-phosphate dependent enzyme n=1 Tax=Diaporthe ampelina TaxID=1214573 RepID=A0A0G2HVE4_9PEZI|nr:putative pyridoxal-phosphate dependent enzyme [Diaporthe ampelina]
MADLETCPPLTRASVVAAHDIVRPHVHRTPVLTNSTLSRLASTPAGDRPGDREAAGGDKQQTEGGEEGGEKKARPVIRLWFKCENLQRVGAFKVRGAFHAVERLKADQGWVAGGGLGRGVVTHSSGNHAQALALAARESGIPAHIIMPEISAPGKVAATRGYGANVVFSGSTSVEREAVAARVMAETGATLVPPYDHPDIILGQGTMGLEFQDQVAELMTAGPGTGEGAEKSKGLDAIITPCGGGGMLSGVALSCEGTGVRVFGAEPSFQGADDCRRGLAAGRRVESVSTLTVADGLRTPVGAIPWGIIHDRKLVEGVFAVAEAQIAAALRLVLERMKVVVEPSSAVPLAVVLFNEEFRALVEREAGPEGWDVGVVFSGGNVGLDKLGTLFAS